VQREIAASVAAVLKDKLLGDGYSPVLLPVSDTPNAQAYEHYLRGKFFHNRRGPGDNERAKKHFELALEIDPNLADAWVGLVSPMFIQTFRQEITLEELVTRSKAVLNKALELDPNHAEAHIRLARLYPFQGLDIDVAQQHFDQALRYGQNSALVLSMAAGEALLVEANFERAIELQRRAVALDPLGAVNRFNLAAYLTRAGHLGEAWIEYLNALELSPENENRVNESLGEVLVLQQEYKEARVLFQQLPEGLARDMGMAMIHHALNQETQSNAAIECIKTNPGVESATRLAEIYAHRGNLDESFKWLATATDRTFDSSRNYRDWHYLKLMFTSPFLRPLHDDPRWERWLADKKSRTTEGQM